MDNKKVFIVAEVGVNHGGSFGIAKALLAAAINAGVDAVKLQLWQPKTFPKLESLRLSNEHIAMLMKYVEAQGVDVFCTAFDIASVRFLITQKMCKWKIPSNRAVLYDMDFLNAIKWNPMRRHTIISTGIMSDDIIKGFYSLFDDKKITLLHCVSEYPTPTHKLNLDRMLRLKHELGCDVGLSDHSGNYKVPIAAAYLGADMIECHITLDKMQDGPDHKASLNPQKFKKVVQAIRNMENG